MEQAEFVKRLREAADILDEARLTLPTKDEREGDDKRWGWRLWSHIYDLRKEADDTEYEFRIKEKYADDKATANSLIHMKRDNMQCFRNYKCPHCGHFDSLAVVEDFEHTAIECEECGRPYACTTETHDNTVCIPVKGVLG